VKKQRTVSGDILKSVEHCERGKQESSGRKLFQNFPSFLHPQTMSAEDVFEGAVGIDLGTTYSYLTLAISLSDIHYSPAVSVFGKMTVSKSSQTTVCIPFLNFFSSVSKI
jgi:hypothetical protein